LRASADDEAELVARKEELVAMKLRQIMSAPVLTVTGSEPASDALARMRDARVRHAVVVSDGRVIGVVSDRDLGGARGGVVRRGRTVRDLMNDPGVAPTVAGPETSVAEAALLLREQRIGCIPVVDCGGLVGIVTRGDVLSALATRRRGKRVRGREGHGSRSEHEGAARARPPLVSSPNRDKWP
jgi:CBS domain-containing protein